MSRAELFWLAALWLCYDQAERELAELDRFMMHAYAW